jgi:hypothetical protein
MSSRARGPKRFNPQIKEALHNYLMESLCRRLLRVLPRTAYGLDVSVGVEPSLRLSFGGSDGLVLDG